MICAGIDAGSRAIKIVLMDSNSKEVLAKGLIEHGIEQNKLALTLFEKLLKKSCLKKNDVRRIAATGYGRNIISIADTTITEITCQAAGVQQLVPDVKTIIDIGGQDSKLLRLDKNGKVRDFSINDRCAAGTGRFLEIVTKRLGCKLKVLGQIAVKSKKPSVINSMCVVFAESEIIGLLADGHTRENIAAGVQSSIAARVKAMAGSNLIEPIIFTGGVALVPGMADALAKRFGQKITVCPEPRMSCAIGAAVMAADHMAD